MPENKRDKIIVIVGPTASGKSDLAIKLAKKFNGEIISADSRQVYRGMDIGTGKVARDATFPVPNLKLKIKNLKLSKTDFYSNGIRHHLIDVISPKKQFTVSDFKRLGERAIQDILKRGKLPIITGGTGLYVDTLVYDREYPAVSPNLKFRAKLEKQSVEKLFNKLRKLDHERAKTIDPKNKRRLIRALEIIHVTGKKVPKLDMTYSHDRIGMYTNPLIIGIKINQNNLNKRIKKRLDERLKQGLVKEVRKLHKSGLSWNRLESFGLEYKWVAQFLQNKIARFEMEIGLLRDIIHYSKRQMTWFKRNHEIQWFKKQNNAENLLAKFLR